MTDDFKQPFGPGAEIIVDENGMRFIVHDPAILDDLKEKAAVEGLTLDEFIERNLRKAMDDATGRK